MFANKFQLNTNQDRFSHHPPYHRDQQEPSAHRQECQGCPEYEHPEEQPDHLYQTQQHEQECDQERSLNSNRAPTIHPTIANMVTSKLSRPTLCSSSPPSSHTRRPLPSFYRRSFSPISYSPRSSLSPKNAPMSPEPESEPMQPHQYPRHHHHTSTQARHNRTSDPLHYRDHPYRHHVSRRNSDSSHSSYLHRPVQRRDSLHEEDMEVDHAFAYEKMSPDLMMDQCEPQKDWSSALSQRTNSPSPVMSCATDELLPNKRRQSSYLHHQGLPPLLPQPLRGHQEQPSSAFPGEFTRDPWPRTQGHCSQESHHHQHKQQYRHCSSPQGSYQEHCYHQDHQQPQRRNSMKAAPYSFSDISARGSSVALSSLCSKTSLKTFPSEGSRTRPFSVPNCTSIDILEQHSSASASAGALSIESSSLPPLQTFATVAQENRKEGPTPGLDTPPSSEIWCNLKHNNNDQQKQSTAVLPQAPGPLLRMSFEHVSEAQRVLYERHPPSPKHDRVSSSSSSSSPSTASPAVSSTSSPVSSSATSPRSPPSAPRTLVSESPDQALTSASGRLSFEQGNPLTHTLPRTHSPTLTNDSEHRQYPSQPSPTLQKRYSSPSMIPLQPVSQEGSSSPSVKKTLPPLLPSPSIAPANSNGSTSTAVCDGTSTAPPDAALLNLPGTEGMTVVRNEEGAIMVYNPQTDVMTFRCELCPSESFGRIHDLKRHQTSKHQEMTWPCDFCHRPFVRRDALLRHYTVKSARDDGLHPAAHEVDKLMAARARAKMLC